MKIWNQIKKVFIACMMLFTFSCASDRSLAQVETPTEPLQAATALRPTTALAAAAKESLPTNTIIGPVQTLSSFSTAAPDGTATLLPAIMNGEEKAVPTGIIADHTVIEQFDNIPQSVLGNASSLDVLFMRASTGGYISEMGLNYLQGTRDADTHLSPYPDYQYDRRKWTWELWAGGAGTAPDKFTQFKEIVPARQQNYDVIGMKLCYTDWWNRSWTDYRDMMLDFEQQYPGKTFIWTTQAIMPNWYEATGVDVCQEVQTYNDGIRAYARANNKILFDIADIESKDEQGNTCYPGCERMCLQYAESPTTGHLSWDGSIRVAKGFWWVMARIGGWNPTTTTEP